MNRMTDSTFTFKILLIGNSGVGKSCVVMRFSKMKPIRVNGRDYRLQIWDTAGQDRFRTITCSYYRGCHGILVLYDVTNQDSFDNIKMWMQEIEKNASDEVVVMLVGNKVDMGEYREISTAQGQELANKYNVAFMECSAKKSINIDEVFERITNMMIAKFGDKIKPDSKAIRLGNSYSNHKKVENDDNCCN